MVPRQRAQPVTAITTPPVGVHIGMRVFANVGTNEPYSDRLNGTSRFAVGRSGNIEEAPDELRGYRRGFLCAALNQNGQTKQGACSLADHGGGKRRLPARWCSLSTVQKQ
jgi:hypothetical protein